jgi:glycosyltransferase involved in cell wall biosynthesis
MGVSRSRNHGIISCNGTYIGFCDADDIWTEDKLEIQIEYLGNNPSYNIIYCDSEIIDENGRPIGQRFSSLYNKTNKRSGNIFAQLCLGNFINTQTVVLNKQCLIDGELFNEHINWGEDWMFWITLARKNYFLYIDEVFAKYRIHSRSTALIHKRGYIEDHLNVRSQVLSKYPDLPSKLSAQILYEIGIAHAQLGEKKAAQKYFLKSLMIDMTNFRALARIFFPKPQSIFYD